MAPAKYKLGTQRFDKAGSNLNPGQARNLLVCGLLFICMMDYSLKLYLSFTFYAN